MTRSGRAVRWIFACGAVLAVGAVAAPAGAQGSRSAQERACGHDVSRHCRRYVSEGDMAVYQCLQNNRDRLSAACRRVVEGN